MGLHIILEQSPHETQEDTKHLPELFERSNFYSLEHCAPTKLEAEIIKKGFDYLAGPDALEQKLKRIGTGQDPYEEGIYKSYVRSARKPTCIIAESPSAEIHKDARILLPKRYEELMGGGNVAFFKDRPLLMLSLVADAMAAQGLVDNQRELSILKTAQSLLERTNGHATWTVSLGSNHYVMREYLDAFCKEHPQVTWELCSDFQYMTGYSHIAAAQFNRDHESTLKISAGINLCIENTCRTVHGDNNADIYVEFAIMNALAQMRRKTKEHLIRDLRKAHGELMFSDGTFGMSELGRDILVQAVQSYGLRFSQEQAKKIFDQDYLKRAYGFELLD